MLVDRPARHVPHAGVSIWSGLAAKASPFSSRPSTSRTRRARCAWCCRSAAYSQRRARGAVYSSIIIVIARQVQAFPWRWWVALVLRRGATPSTRPVTSPTVAGQRWPAHSPSADERRRRTQGCRLDLAGKLVGVHPDVDARTRERIATRLQVPTLTLRDAARAWATSWQARGGAILTVVQSLPVDASLLDRILTSGAVTDLWPTPQRWDPGRGTWVRPRSRGTKRRAPHALQERAPPPTNSPAVSSTPVG